MASKKGVNCKDFPTHPDCNKPTKPETPKAHETPTKPETPKTHEKDEPFKKWDKLKKAIDSALETDSDGDGIPDALEQNGYTISEVFDQDGGYFHVMPWLETYDHNPEFYKHHPKYISNPFDKNTVGDPYTDLEKAGHSIYIEGSILPEAYHPLVAACPSVAIFMEEFILKEWKEVEETYTTGYSYHTSYGFEETRTSGSGTDEAKGGKLEFGGKGSAKGGEKPQVSGSLQGGVHLSTNLKHHTNEQQGVTTISSLQESNRQSKESSTTLHSASAAILQGIVRYRNMGTAKISNVRPTLNFQVADLPLSTYQVPEVAKLSPGDSYPAFGATGVIVTPSDSFQGHPSTISTDAKNKLAAGNPLKVATTQIQGTFTAAPGSGKYRPGTSIDWSDVTDTMMNRTARLLLETPNETLDRRVAAPSADEVVDTPDKTKPESGIPRVTVEQALQFAFGATQDNRGNLMVTTPQGFTYRIDRSHVTLYVDQKTDDLIAKQLQAFKDKGDKTKSVYDVILTKEMVILIKPIIEVRAFLSNAYLYIENQFDQSLSYSVWKNTGTSSELLKRGIVPSASTIGTGYFCGNPAEELSIMVSRQVSQVIFEGKVSALTGFVNHTLQPIGEALHLHLKACPIQWTSMPVTNKSTLKILNDPDMFCKELKVNTQDQTIDLPFIMTRRVYDWGAYETISQVQYEYTIDKVTTSNTINISSNQFGQRIKLPITITQEKEVSVKLKLKLYGGVHYTTKCHKNQDLNETFCIYGGDTNQLLLCYSDELEFKMGKSKSYEGKQPIAPANINNKQGVLPVSFYQQADKINLFNRSSQKVSYCILNEYKESMWEGSLEPNELIEFTFEELSIWKNGVYGGDSTKLSDRIIITIDQIPIFDGMPKDIPSKETMQGYVSGTVKAHTLDYWHLNSREASYDSVCFKKIDSKYLNALASYEIKVDGNSIGIMPIHTLELDGKLMINFFDYTADASKHPKKGQQVEIIAHDIFGNTTSVFKGRAELSDALWREHYKINEWHQKGEHFDALYLAPVPTGLTESVKSYDIQIGSEMPDSVLFERPDNESYIRDQRLKLDLSKKLPQDKLPKLGDSVHLFIHTIENQPVKIDLGKIVASDQQDSINALEKVHEITTWTKDSDHYTSVQFNKGSENITSYVFQVNNRYYGEIPVNQATTKLDLSKLDTDKKIRKGDYVEIYAYKKDGEGVLIQSRYAGTTGLLGAYPVKEKIQQEYHVTNWSKVTDSYTSFTLGPLSDPIDSYIKKYEGCINNSIINLTPNGLTFTFDTNKGPRHGDIVQLFAYTYSGDKIELWKLPAGAIGTVTDEEVQSMYELQKWENGNETLVFNPNTLQAPILTHIKDYTIEIGKLPYTKWNSFGKSILLTGDGKLHLKDCDAQPLPSHTTRDIIKVRAILFDGRQIVILDAIPIGLANKLTEEQIHQAHEHPVFSFNKNGICDGFTFKDVKVELESYIKNYQVQIWSEIPQTISPDSSQYQFSNEKGVLITFKPDKQTIQGGQEQDKITVTVHLVNNLSVQVYSALPVQQISNEAIKAAHQIDHWMIFNSSDDIQGFYFNEKLKSVKSLIQFYSMTIDEKHYEKLQIPLALETEQDRDWTNRKDSNNHEIQGFPFRFSNYKIYGGTDSPYPKVSQGKKLSVIAHLHGEETVTVIDNITMGAQ